MKHLFLSPPENILRRAVPGMFIIKCALGLSSLVAFSSVELYSQVTVTATAGTSNTSYTTVNAAFTAINAGTHQGAVTITVNANTTEPATPVPLLRSNSPSSYTSILIKPAGNVTINSAASPVANRGIIELAGADNVTIDGDDPATTGSRNLSIVAATATTAGVAVIRLSSNSTTGTDGANNNTIKNCIITGSRNNATSTTNSYGIQFSNGTSTSSSGTGAYSSLNTIIQNNLITKAYYGINAIGNSTTYYNTGTQILGNTIGSATSGQNVGLYGIHSSYSSAGTTGAAIIDGNDIQGGDATTGFGTNVSGIYLNTSSNNTIIRKNNIHNVANPSSGGWGAYGIGIVAAVTGVEISNNFIRDITTTNYSSTLSTTWQNYGIFVSSGATGMKIIHNTIYLNLANATNVGTANPVSACINFTSSSATVSQMHNNILVNNQGTASTNAYCIITSGTGNISGGAINNNNYNANGNGKIGYYNSPAATLNAWQTATGKDALSLSEIPPFTSATDLHIPANSITLLESAGATVATTGINMDIDGQTRPGISSYGFGTAPDMGADEFDGKVQYTCTTPMPGNTITTANNLCAGQPIGLSLQNPTTGTGVSYQWQSSPDNITYTNVAAAVSPTLSLTPAAASWYRCKVKCLSGPDSTYSTPVNIIFVNNVLTTTNGTRCGTGTVLLQATGNTGATLNWYAAATGGTSLGTGTTFTTPSLLSTTNFYVSAEAVASGGAATIGTPTTTSSGSGTSPFSQNWESNHSQYLILASDLTASGLAPGNITGMSLNVTAKSSTFPFTGYSIKMAHSALTGLTTLTAPTFTNVYGPTNYTSVAGANNFTFTAPFNWDGTSNILVDICFDNDPAGSGTFWSSNDEVQARTTAYTSVAGNYADNSTLCGSTTAGTPGTVTTLPIFKFTGNAVCPSPRKAVTATVTPAPAFDITNDKTVCNNGITTLTVTTGAANYNNITWLPVTNLYTNAAATIPYTAGSNTNTVYHRSTTVGLVNYTANALNTTSLCGNLDTVKIQTLPATVTAVATVSTMCQTGSSSLTLTPAITQTNVGYQWQSSLNNTTFTDITGATSATYTTPTITTTNYYRASIKNSDGNACFNSVSDTVFISNPVVLSANSAERCGPGILDLTATTNPGYTLNWYAAASGGTAIASGPVYTTPSLSTTTNYYVSSEYIVPKDITIGTPTTTTSNSGTSPFSQNWESNHSQYLILASDLTAAGFAAGTINSMSLNITSKVSTLPFTGYSIKMANSALTNVAALTAPTFTNVYGPVNYTSVAGANNFAFTTPFNWNGTSNILVDICFDNDPAGAGTFWSSNDVVESRTTTYTSVVGSYADNTTLCGATTGGTSGTVSNLPVFKFSGTISCISPRTTVTATIKPKPTASLTPTGTINLCNNDTEVLTAGGGGTYTWLRNGTAIPGQTNATLSVSQTDPYKVVVTAANGCTDTSLVANIIVQPDPVVFLGNDTTYCGNIPYTLNAGNPGASYLWNNNSTGSTLNVLNRGAYSVTVTNTYNCSSSDTINISHYPYPIVNLGNDTVICRVSPLILNAANSGAAFLWNTNDSTQTISVNQAGTYSVTVSNGFNCIGKDTINISLHPIPDNYGFNFEPLFTVQPGRVKFTPVNLNPAYTYFWNFGDGNGSDSAIAIHNYLSSGTYNVSLLASDGCTDSVENLEIYVDLYTNVVKVNKATIAVKVYPNPSNNILNVQLESDQAYIKSLTVFNVLGQQVFHALPVSKQSVKEQISLDQLASGAYIIKIETDKGIVNRKFDLIK
ncbi:MAG: T9SS type A sorting domain-containing protein [Sphingobacteriales bacterium]|nr:MAG: T9SS type A sorting domain-containing protein [Sphingobacteriales bacterium]